MTNREEEQGGEIMLPQQRDQELNKSGIQLLFKHEDFLNTSQMFLSVKRGVEEKLAHDLLMLPSVKPNKGNVC